MIEGESRTGEADVVNILFAPDLGGYGVIVVDAVGVGLPTGVGRGGALETGSVPIITDVVEAVGGRPAWHRDALCREHPEVDWFPSHQWSNAPAQRICAQCLVRADCLAWALDQGPHLAGIWGGTTQPERALLAASGTSAASRYRQSTARPI